MGVYMGDLIRNGDFLVGLFFNLGNDILYTIF